MAKINAAGEPTFYDARGTDEVAESADGSVHHLDPTASVQDGEVKDNPGLVVEDDGDFETREEREQRELREREQDARERTEATNREAEAHAHESGDAKSPADVAEVKSSAGTASKASSKSPAKSDAKN